MADPQIIWDTPNDSTLEKSGPNVYRAVRAGGVFNVPFSVGDTSDDFLFKVVRILEANGAAYNSAHPSSANSYLNRIQIFGATNDSATFRLFYEPFTSTNNSVLQVSSTHRKAIVVTDRVPGTGAMLRVSYDVNGDTSIIPPDLLKVAVLRSLRVISVFKVNVGTLPLSAITGESEYIDCVNDAPWCGRPKGGWRVDAEETSVSRYAGFWTQQLAAIAAGRVDEVHDVIGVLQSTTNGKFAASDKTIQAIAEDVAKPYKFGIITTPDVPGFFNPDYGYIDAQYKKGFIRAGMYKTANFASFFGFGATGDTGLTINQPNPTSFGFQR